MLRRLLLVVLILLVAAAPALAAPATEANIDWRQAEGASIIVAMNLHMETDELDAQLAEFEELTGIRVNFQIYPEIELHQKTLVDLAFWSWHLRCDHDGLHVHAPVCCG